MLVKVVRNGVCDDSEMYCACEGSKKNGASVMMVKCVVLVKVVKNNVSVMTVKCIVLVNAV